jgi:toxin ParE1/3/4
MPDMGRKCGEIRKGYQRHEYARHIIFYKKRDHDILIVRILYDAMDAKRHL